MSDDNKLSVEQLSKLSVDELTELSGSVAGRLNNEDWQKVVYDLRISGHMQKLEASAPPLLQSFLRLEIDLDEELGKLASAAPLMSSIKLTPRRPRGEETSVKANFNSQDGGAIMQVEVQPKFDFFTRWTFSIGNMLSLHYRFPNLPEADRTAFLDMMRRDTGLTILWTPDRWEQDYIIFSREEFYTRVYAFSPHFDSMARVTTESLGTLLDWLDRAWFPRQRGRRKRSTQLLEMPAWRIEEKPVEPEKKKTQQTQPIITFDDDDIADRLMQLDPPQRLQLAQPLKNDDDRAALDAVFFIADQGNREMLKQSLKPEDKQKLISKVHDVLIELTSTAEDHDTDKFTW